MYCIADLLLHFGGTEEKLQPKSLQGGQLAFGESPFAREMAVLSVHRDCVTGLKICSIVWISAKSLLFCIM